MADPTVFENGYVAVSTASGSAVYTELPGVKSISLPISRAELDDSVMGDLIEAKYPGILQIPISVVCRQDFATAFSATAGIDKMAHDRMIARSKFRLKVRAVDAAASGPNPSYILSKVGIFNTSPIDGAHGVALENKLELRVMSGCTLTRSTAT